MRLIVTEMREDLSLSYNMNNNKFSDDEEDNDKGQKENILPKHFLSVHNIQIEIPISWFLKSFLPTF